MSFWVKVASEKGNNFTLQAKKLQTISTAIESIKIQIVFLYACIENGVFPQSTDLGLSRKMAADQRLVIKIRTTVLRHFIQKKKKWLHNKIVVYKEARRIFDSEFGHQDIHAVIAKFVRNETQRHQRRLDRKLQWLTGAPPAQPAEAPAALLNLSDFSFSKQHIELLQKGPAFVPAPAPDLRIKTAAAIEASSLPSDQKLAIAHRINSVTASRGPPAQMLNLRSVRSLASTLRRNSLACVLEDKGGRFVILPMALYREKTMEQIAISGPVAIPGYDMAVAERDAIKILRSFQTMGVVDRTQYLAAYPHPSPPPRAFASIKTHKPGLPARVIIDYGSYSLAGLSRLLSTILHASLPSSKYAVASTTAFLELLKVTDVSDSFVMASLDIVNLFPSLNREDSICLCVDRCMQSGMPMRKVSIIHQALQLISDNLKFIFDGRYFQCTSGWPAGHPLSAFMAELVLNALEVSLVDGMYRQGSVALFCRYVDDCFIYGSAEAIASLHDAFNSQRAYISYTIERQNDETRTLKYLDLYVSVGTQTFSFKHALKPASVRLSIPIDSYQPPSHKLAALRSAAGKARLCNSNPVDRDAELELLAHEALLHGHSKQAINRVMESIPTSTASAGGGGMDFIPIPFSTSNSRAARGLSQHRVAWSNSSSLSALLCNVKYKPPACIKNGIVYSLPCSVCASEYVGSSARSLKIRVYEHQKAFNRRDKASALVHHFQITGHTPNFSAARVIYFEKSNVKRLKIESLLIQAALGRGGPPPLNLTNTSSPLTATWIF